ncbi:MAG: hypothetical protein FI702_10640 [SAR202 cluster bacterium]|nr:hypothetical protein [SAR202 cluster bacterium]
MTIVDTHCRADRSWFEPIEMLFTQMNANDVDKAPEHELTEQKVPYETGVARYREIARGQIPGDDSGLLKILIHREDRRLLGVHAIGTGATELIRIGKAVLGLGGGLDYLLETVFNYPTLAERYRVVALDAFNKSSH